MQLDDLKQAWRAHAATLERGVAVNERLLREVLLRRVRFALAPYLLWRGLEVALGCAALLVVLPVLAAHAGESRYLVVGGALAVFAVAITALNAYVLVHALTIDSSGPVARAQREVERVQWLEFLGFKWALLGGVVLWLPALLVAAEALAGVDALARVELPYLLANLLFGIAILALGLRLSRKYVERDGLSPVARKVVDALSGRGLRAAAGHLAELARFERND